ncbi:acetyl-CoA synthetase, partial [Celeribacter indicus]
MTDAKTYPPSESFAQNAHIDRTRYEELYARSVEDPVGFWAEQGKVL